MINFPGNNQWSQPNVGDTQGSFWNTNTIDLSENLGKIRLGKRMILNTSTDDVASITGVPVGFRVFGSGSMVYTAAGSGGTGYVFNTTVNALDNAFAKNTVSGGVTAPSTIDSAYSDMEILNGQLFVTTASKAVYYLNNAGTAWNTFNMTAGAAANRPHMLAIYANRMYCTYDSNSIISWDNTATPVVATAGATYTLSLGTDESVSVITFIKAAANRIWIGTLNKQGGKGYIHSWDGSSSQVTASYRLKASGAVSCVIVNDVPYIMDTLGNLAAWNGGTFVEIAGFNIQNVRNLFNATGSTNLRYIHPNGMSLMDGKVCLLIDGRNNDGAVTSPDTITQLQTIPSGVWEYDTKTGLVHKHSIYFNKTSDTITGYGQTRVKGVGGLSDLIFIQNSQPQQGSFLVGASYSDDTGSSGATKYGVFYDDLQDLKTKAGSFVTRKTPSRNISDMYQKVYPDFRPLLNAADKLVFKYRINDTDFTEYKVIPTSTSTITTLGDLTALWAIGDEVEFIQGVNGGICAHITAIAYNGTTTTTITLDEPITSNSPHTSQVRIQKWVKIGTIAFNDDYPDFPVETEGYQIQFKIWMLWTGKNELEGIAVTNQPHRKYE